MLQKKACERYQNLTEEEIEKTYNNNAPEKKKAKTS